MCIWLTQLLCAIGDIQKGFKNILWRANFLSLPFPSLLLLILLLCSKIYWMPATWQSCTRYWVKVIVDLDPIFASRLLTAILGMIKTDSIIKCIWINNPFLQHSPNLNCSLVNIRTFTSLSIPGDRRQNEDGVQWKSYFTLCEGN